MRPWWLLRLPRASRTASASLLPLLLDGDLESNPLNDSDGREEGEGEEGKEEEEGKEGEGEGEENEEEEV